MNKPSQPNHQPQTEYRYFALNKVLMNPFQTRQTRDPRGTLKLAKSILLNTMIQPPIGRLSGSDAQLAVGAGRYAAHCMIAQVQKRIQNDQTPLLGEFGINNPNDEDSENFAALVALALEQSGKLETILIGVRELTDRQMFEFAVAENNDRDDITEMEKALAVKSYIEDFGASSAEAGRLFGMSGSAIRGLIRLLNLPQVVINRIDEGSLSSGQGAKLLVLQALRPALVEKAADQIKAGDPVRAVDGVIQSVLAKDKASTLLCEGWRKFSDGQARAFNMWPIDDFAPAIILHATAKEIVKNFAGIDRWLQAIDDSRKPADTLAIMLDWLTTAFESPDAERKEITRNFCEIYAVADDDVFMANLIALVAPPACGRCPLHRVIDGSHYCANSACAETKKGAWIRQRAELQAVELGIKLYAPEDGEYVLDAYMGYGLRDDGTFGVRPNPFDEWLLEKRPELRIVCESGGNMHVKEPNVSLAAVGSLVQAYNDIKLGNSKNDQTARTEARQVKPKHSVYDIINAFVCEKIDLFLPAFATIPTALVPLICGPMIEPGEELGAADDFCLHTIATRSIIAWIVANEYYNDSLEFAASMIQEELAASIELKLPDGFVQMAADYEQQFDR